MRRARAVLPALGAGVLAVIGLTALRVQTEFVWGWAVLVVAAVLLLGLRLPDDSRIDAPRVSEQPDHVGSDVSRLAWAINLSTDTVNEAVTRRVRAILRRRLLRRGVDVDDPGQSAEADRLLGGGGLWARLNGQRTRVDDVRDALAAAERLLVSPRDDPPHRHDLAAQKESTP